MGHIICRILYIDCPKRLVKINYFAGESVCILIWNTLKSKIFIFGSFSVSKLITSFFEMTNFFEIPHFLIFRIKWENGTFQIFRALKTGCFEKKTRDQFRKRIRTENENLGFWDVMTRHSTHLNLGIVQLRRKIIRLILFKNSIFFNSKGFLSKI